MFTSLLITPVRICLRRIFLNEKEMAYLYLAVAIIAEVTATSALKATEEFTKLYPSLIVIIGYGVAFYFMTLVLRTIPVGITYAVWSGLGVVLVAIVGAVLYKQIPDIAAIIGMGLIITGVLLSTYFQNRLVIRKNSKNQVGYPLDEILRSEPGFDFFEWLIDITCFHIS